MGKHGLATATILLALCALSADSPAQKSGSLSRKLDSVRSKKSAVRAKLKETRKKAKVVLKDLHAVDEKIETVHERLESTKQNLTSARKQQRQVTTTLAQVESDLEKARAQARARLRVIAKQGNGTPLAALTGSQSVGDFAERQYLMERIAKRDHELFAKVRDLQRQVAQKKVEKDRLVVSVSSLAQRQKAQEGELKVVRNEKGEILNGLQRQASQLEAALRQFEADEAEISRLIALSRRSKPGGSNVPAYLGRFLRPVNARITSTFGRRFHPVLHKYRSHDGIDFGASYGTPVRCAAPGEVIAATVMRGYGNVVIVDHGGGLSTVYAHLSRVGVRGGQRLSQGQMLGNVGATGLATGPHLHWEVRLNGRAVNPQGKL